MVTRLLAAMAAVLPLVLTTGSLGAQDGHADNVEAAIFTPDGKLALTASDDKTIGIWETATGRLVRRLTGHTEAVHGLALAPERSRVVSLAAEGEVKTWELETGRCLLTYKLPYKSYAVAWMPSGRQVLFADDKGGVEARDPFRGELLWRAAPPPDAPADFGWSLLVSPGQRYLVAGTANGRTRIWDLGTRLWLRDLPAAGDRVWALAATPDGQTLFTGYGLCGQTWDLATGQRRLALPLDNAILSFGVTADGRKLVTGSNPVTVWDLQTGQCLQRDAAPGGEGAVWAISPDCRQALFSLDTQETHRVEFRSVRLD